MTTTITCLQAFKYWMAGKTKVEKIERQQLAAQQALPNALQGLQAFNGQCQANSLTSLQNVFTSSNTFSQLAALQGSQTFDYWAAYKAKQMPDLQAAGYQYFLQCKTDDYVAHEEWCKDNCQDYTVANQGLYDVAPTYPRAFANVKDAMYFMLSWEAVQIKGIGDVEA